MQGKVYVLLPITKCKNDFTKRKKKRKSGTKILHLFHEHSNEQLRTFSINNCSRSKAASGMEGWARWCVNSWLKHGTQFSPFQCLESIQEVCAGATAFNLWVISLVSSIYPPKWNLTELCEYVPTIACESQATKMLKSTRKRIVRYNMRDFHISF